MKSNVPWSVKGIDPEARAVAKEAARKAGMTLGEWMNQMIREMGDEEKDEGQAPAPVSRVSTEQLRAVVDSLNRLNERLKTTEDELKVTEARQRQATSDIGQGLETVFERMKRLERERREGAPEQLAERVDKLERGEGDRGRIEGLKKLESALTGMVEALEVTRAEALDKIEENEAAVQSLAARVETLDDRLTAGFAEVHDAIDAVGQHLDRTERTAQAVITDAKEAAASTDAQFVEATSKRLMILGTEIKRSGDQIRTVEEMVTRLSDKIEAAEQRSAEGSGAAATSLDDLRREVVGDGEAATDAEANGLDLPDLEREGLAEAAREADKKVSRLQRSYEQMMARLEGREVGGTDGSEAPDRAANDAARAETTETELAEGAAEAERVGGETAEGETSPPAASLRAEDGEAPARDPVINDTLAAGLGLIAPVATSAQGATRASTGSAGADDDFDEVFSTDSTLRADPDAQEASPSDATADARSVPFAASAPVVAAPLPDEAEAEAGAKEGADASTSQETGTAEEPPADGARADLARLTPRQKVLLAAKARKKRLEAERAEEAPLPADDPAPADDDALIAPSPSEAVHPEQTDTPRRFGAREVALALLLLGALALSWFWFSPRGGEADGDRPAPTQTARTTDAPNATGRLGAPVAASGEPAAPSGPTARDLYAEGVAAYEAGRAEEAFGLFLQAEGDYVPARMRVGFALMNGIGTEANLTRARSYLVDAANVGNIAAMHLLGNIAAADNNGASAVDWFERAADHGVVNSMYNLGYLLNPAEAQEIVPAADRDAARAYEFYSLAASLGDGPSAEEAAAVGAALTPEARAAIDARVADWTPLPVLASVNDGLNPPEPITQ